MESDERDFVPYEVTGLRGERMLVLAPHPDDEVIGCGGLLALHAQEKRVVRVIVVTDGAAGVADGKAAGVATRQSESIAALAELGAGAPRFLGLPDRGLVDRDEEMAITLRAELLDFRPDLVLAPSPAEIHPDHRAVAESFIRLVQRDAGIAAALAVCTVAFYEVGRPILPNALVDITAVADRKFAAIAAHTTQAAQRDYAGFARGLNQFRAMTLGTGVRYAEAYRTFSLQDLRTLPLAKLVAETIGAPEIAIERELLPVTVVVRTRNRIAWLQEAVASIRANRHPAKIVVVNDGGESPRDALASHDVFLVENQSPLGRSEAMNRGVEAAGSGYVAFLDDDDIFYPDHLETLARATAASAGEACYSDAVSAFMARGDDGAFHATKKLRLYESDFDRDLLLFDNFVPLPTLLVARDDYHTAGGFDPAFDLFEDWDFLIRLSRFRPLRRIPRITCEIRHFEGSNSIILDANRETFRAAKFRIWKKHRALLTDEALAAAFEIQKERAASSLRAQLVEAGRGSHLERDVARLERDKQTLIDRIGHDTGTIDALRNDLVRLSVERDAADSARAAAAGAVARLTEAVGALQTVVAQRDQSLDAYIREVARLNALLDTIYGSKTWKLHSLLHRPRGKRE